MQLVKTPQSLTVIPANIPKTFSPRQMTHFSKPIHKRFTGTVAVLDPRVGLTHSTDVVCTIIFLRATSFNPFVGKRTNSSATYPYPFRYPWGPLLSLFVATKDYYRMSSHVFPSLCSSLDIFARFAPFLRQKTRVFDLYSI